MRPFGATCNDQPAGRPASLGSSPLPPLVVDAELLLPATEAPSPSAVGAALPPGVVAAVAAVGDAVAVGATVAEAEAAAVELAVDADSAGAPPDAAAAVGVVAVVEAVDATM